MQQPINPNPLSTTTTTTPPPQQQPRPSPKLKKSPTPQDLVTHYTEQGLDSQAASFKVIEDLQNVLYRMISSNSSRNKKDKILTDASMKMDNLNSKLGLLNMKIDSKPGYAGVFVIGVASAATLDGVKAVLPSVFQGVAQIWGAVRGATTSK
ncbi:hypothetical protein ACFE04_031519 [Oxalis oulophora]